MNKAYNRINWENYPSDSTPLNEDNLNKMDVAINEVDNRVISLDTTKLPVATAYTMVKDVAFDEKTGIFTITKLNGSVIKIDTALEKISTNFRFDYSTQKLILTLIDGTTQEVDLSALLTQYEFTDSDTIAFTIDTSGKVVASVKKGSITQDMLEPNYLANIKVEVAKAESASLSADTSAKNAKTSETNAKTSEEKAREYAEASSGIGALISSFATGTNPTIQDSTNAPLIYGKFKGYTLQDGEPTPDNPVEINGLAKGGAIEVKTTGKNIFGGLALAQALVDSGSTNVVLDTDAKTVTFGYNTNYTDKEKKKLFTDFKENTQYTLFLRGKNISLDVSNTSNNLNISIAYTDGTYDYLVLSDFTQGDSFDYRFITNENKNVTAISHGYNENDTNLLYYEQCGIFEGVITADEFEPYTETTTAITTGAPLYEGDYIEIYADGSGKEYRKMKEIVLDKNVSYNATTSANSTGDTIYFDVPKTHNLYKYNGVLKCVELTNQDIWSNDVEGIMYEGSKGLFSIRFRIKKSRLVSEDVAGLKAWLAENPLHIVVELAEPTETPLTAEQVAQFKQLYTFEPVTNVFCDGEVEVLYYKNTDNGETVGIVHKKVEKNERTVNSVNNYYSSFKQNYNTVVGGTVSNNMSNVEYTEPSFSKDGSMYYDVYKGNTLVNGLKSATAKIAETLGSMCDFFAKKTLYDDTTINIGRKASTTIGNYSTAEGADNTASASYSHAEGYKNVASGNSSHAEGRNTTASGMYSHAECYSTKAEGNYSHAEGNSATASGESSHAEGYSTTAEGDYSHAEGSLTTAEGMYSHAEGYQTTAYGMYSHAEGYQTTAEDDYSHAEGNGTIALHNQHAQGHYNDTTLATMNSNSGVSNGTAFVIGNGSYGEPSNALRVTGYGEVYAKDAYNATGADYAEFAEWADENPNNEDRRGYFVTFDEEKPNMIRKANEGEYILGIVSGNPCIIGNSDEGWRGKYVFDEFGAIVYEEIEEEVEYTDIETGEVRKKTELVTTYKLNPEYDKEREYIHRSERPEWDYVGWIGVLSVRDDGTCLTGGYCKAANGGIATVAERGTDTYRVLERINDNVIKVALK